MAGPTPKNQPFPAAPINIDVRSTHKWMNDVRDWANQFVLDFDPPGAIPSGTSTANALTTVIQWEPAKKASQYLIYRNAANNFAVATLIGIIPASKVKVARYQFQDSSDSLIPGDGTRYYWVVPANERGYIGPKSAAISVTNFANQVTGTAVGINARAGEKGVAVGEGADSSAGGGLQVAAQAYGYHAVTQFSHEVVFGSADASVNIFGFVASQNSARFQIFAFDEQVQIAAAAFTDTSDPFPANCIILGASVRVVTTIPTAATFTVTLATAGTQLDVAGGVSTAANTTDVGTRNCPTRSTSTQFVRITPNLLPATNAGRVRVAIYYYQLTPPIS